MYLKCYAGDTVEFSITPLLRSLAWSDIDDWDFIFTAKEALADVDADALIQRTEAHGITLVQGTMLNEEHTATIPNGLLDSITLKLVHADTNNLQGKTLYCDIQAYNDTTEEVCRVAYFRLRIDPAVTRETTTSIPVNS